VARGGIERPRATLPEDICHVGLSVGSRQAVMRCQDRLAQAAVPFWVETHGADDVYAYATDPNGLTLEILADEDGVRGRRAQGEDARRVVERWLAAHG
jgi:hypothetical protein